MSSKMLLSALAAVTAIAVIAAPQDPSFDYPGAKHVGFDVPKEEPAVAFQVSDKLSVSFKNASLREVLDWLKNQGVNFVVQDDQIDKDAKVNINVVNRPVEDVMGALAASWNGHWTKEKDIWVFHEGRQFGGGRELLGELDRTKTLEPPSLLGSGVIVQGDNGNLTKAQLDELRKSMQGMNDPKALEEFRKKWEQWAKDNEKNFQEFQKSWNGKDFQMDPKKLEELRGKGWNFQAPDMKGFKWDGKQFMPMDEKQIIEMQKQAAEMAKQSQKWQNFYPGVIVDGKNFKQLDEKALKDLEKQGFKISKDGNGFRYEMSPLDKKMFQDLSKDGKIWRYTIPPNGKMDEKTLKELEKQGIKVSKDGNNWRYEMSPLDQKRFEELSKDGKIWRYTIPPNGKMDEKTRKELEKQGIKVSKDGNNWRYEMSPFSNNSKGLRDRVFKFNQSGPNPFNTSPFAAPQVSTHASAHNLKAIYDSLTPAQTQKMKTYGYINYSDLNANQRALLGVITDDSWTISYKTDKVNLTIKSDR